MSKEIGIISVVASVISIAVMIMKITLSEITDHLEQILAFLFLAIGTLTTIIKVFNIIIIDPKTDQEIVGKLKDVATGLSGLQIILYFGQFYTTSTDVRSNNW